MPTISILQLNLAPTLEKIMCFFNVELDFGSGCRVTLYGLKLVLSTKDDTLFLGMPQRKGDNDKWYNHFYLSPTLHEAIHATALDKYEHSK